jgi:hypothetical protein
MGPQKTPDLHARYRRENLRVGERPLLGQSGLVADRDSDLRVPGGLGTRALDSRPASPTSTTEAAPYSSPRPPFFPGRITNSNQRCQGRVSVKVEPRCLVSRTSENGPGPPVCGRGRKGSYQGASCRFGHVAGGRRGRQRRRAVLSCFDTDGSLGYPTAVSVALDVVRRPGRWAGALFDGFH